MDFHAAHKILCKYTDEFYSLKKGARIPHANDTFLFLDVNLSRRAIKHVTERRKGEKLSIDVIKELCGRILEAIRDYDFEFLNINQLDYPASIMRAKIFPSSEVGVVIVLARNNTMTQWSFITAFYCRPERIMLMQKKKLQ